MDGTKNRSMNLRMPFQKLATLLMLLPLTLPVASKGDVNVYLLNVPDYGWYAGCFGTANGNLFGFWDRSGFPDFYTGPTGRGVAPMNDSGVDEDGNPKTGIRSMWASKAGMDGRPMNQPGHIDDYWDYYTSDFVYSYESTKEDAYVTAGREEHSPDCIGDFIGLSQKKWVGMNGECDGNIDAYSFVYWETNGEQRVNYAPPPEAGFPAVDIQSGLLAWTNYRGYEADVFTQLADFNPETPIGRGYTANDVIHELTNGYPVLVFLQDVYRPKSRSLNIGAPMPLANPEIHGMLIYGYFEDDYGVLFRCRTSWESGDNYFRDWALLDWTPGLNLHVRGVIGYRPKPQMKTITPQGENLELAWHGPSSLLYDNQQGTTTPLHYYVVEHADRLPASEGDWTQVTTPSTNKTAIVSRENPDQGFYRVRLLE